MDGGAAIPSQLTSVSCMTSASWKFMLVLKTKLQTFSAGMEVSSDQIRGAQAHLNWQFNSVTVQELLYEQTASTSGTANPIPLIYSELKTQDFIKNKTKRGCKNVTWQCLPLQTSICKIIMSASIIMLILHKSKMTRNEIQQPLLWSFSVSSCIRHANYIYLLFQMNTYKTMKWSCL